MKSPGTLFFILLLGYQFLVVALLSQVVHLIPAGFIASPWFLILSQLLMFLLPLGIWLAIKKESLSIHMPNMKLGRTNAILVIGISFFLLPAMMLLSALSSVFFPNVAANLLEQTQTYSIWVMLLAAAVTPAIVEEVVFRGYIQSQYKHWPFWGVALLNGFLFGVAHMHPQQFLYAFAMGVVMAYMVYYSRSIRAGILSHFFINAFNIVMFRGAVWLLGVAEEIMHETGDIAGLAAMQEAAAEVSPWSAILGVGILTLVFLPFAIILFRTFISHNRQRMAEYDIKQALAGEEQ
ncbi:MAG: CPBP family intramembrane metalloprotease [Defluviitaleaceae bacterium]|nr:CPBP family intramembrane metalloprotease [Defluviitaleaceae bacterium]MCL2239484.1 CPBP family intramembrane metalloprotease [Defluviitaleaceae bacterium]